MAAIRYAAACLAAGTALAACGEDDSDEPQRAPGSAAASTRAAAADIAECLTGAGFEARRDDLRNPFRRESTALRATPLGDPGVRVTLFVFENADALASREAALKGDYGRFETAGKVGLGSDATAAARRVTEEIEGSGCLE